MIPSNFHTHTTRCKHATGTEREYIEAAIAIGMEKLGFADHCPVPYKTGFVSNIRMDMSEAEGYVSCIRKLAEGYANQIEIHVGFEMEYMPRYYKEQIKFFDEIGIEYLIMGEHWWTDEETGIYSGAPCGKRELSGYVDTVIEGMETGRYSYLCHPDLINYSANDSFYRKEMTRLCKRLKELDIPVELNLLGFATNRHYPRMTFWDIVAEVGCNAIIGIDAHMPEQLQNESAYIACQQILQARDINQVFLEIK